MSVEIWRVPCLHTSSKRRDIPVTQQAVERAIGKLTTDPDFRTRFFANPAAASWEAGLRLSPTELDALSALSYAAITRLAESLDSRIRRLSLDVTNARRPTQCASGDNDRTESGT
jgi:hypothetical protein